jgi:thiamine biosynthesis lipoprotein
MATTAMATRFELVILSGRADLRAAGEAALDEILLWHARLNRFAPDSLVSHINRTAADAPVRLDRDTFALFADAARVWRDSGGAFDITIAPAMQAHGGAAAPAVPLRHARVGAGAVVLDDDEWTLRFASAAVSIDLGGIAKGHALDCASAVLRAHGVDAALLHGGTSSIVALGAPAGNEGWRVATGPEPGAPVVTMRDEAISVSASAAYRTSSAVRQILDARTLQGIETPRRAVVVGPSARVADAWSTALAVLGRVPDRFPAGYAARITSLSTSQDPVLPGVERR